MGGPSTSMDEVIAFEGVVKSFRMRNRSDTLRDAIPRVLGRLVGRTAPPGKRFVALDGVSFCGRKGEAVGIVGANGAGKSTTLRLAAGIYRADSGSVTVHGRVAAMIELGAGFHPDLSGRENVFLAGALLGLRRRDVQEVFDRIVAFADIGEFLDAPIRTYSSGMAVRLGFAVAAHVPAEVLLIDEVLAVGDLEFQERCLRRMAERRAEGVAILFVSHNMTIVEQFCDRVVVLHHGKVVADGPPRQAVAEYRRRLAEGHGGDGKAESGNWFWRPRHGTGHVKLEGVRLVAEPDLPPGSARPGGRLSVEATWIAESPYSNPLLGVAIHSHEGALCFESTTEGTPPGVLHGRGELRVEFSPLLLLPGDYEISVFAKDSAGIMPLDVHARMYPLRVLGARPEGERGLVPLSPRWSLTRQETQPS